MLLLISAGIFSRNQANIAGQMVKVFETFYVQTPTLTMHYHPADRVKVNPQSRDILGIRNSRGLFVIKKVAMDFEKQYTILKISRREDYA